MAWDFFYQSESVAMQDNEIKDNWRGAGAKRGKMSEPSHDWF